MIPGLKLKQVQTQFLTLSLDILHILAGGSDLENLTAGPTGVLELVVSTMGLLQNGEEELDAGADVEIPGSLLGHWTIRTFDAGA